MTDVPIDSIELYNDSVCLHNLTLMATAQVDALAAIIEELLALTDCDPAANLRHVLIVPDAGLAGAVEHAVGRLTDFANPDYDPPGYVQRTAALPVVCVDTLTTFVIINELVGRTAIQSAHNLDFVVNLLETFLHASLHGKIRQFLIARVENDLEVEALKRGSSRELAARTIEAYLVCRSKLRIMSEHALVELEDGGELRTVIPRPAIDTAARLERSADEMRSIICSASARQVGYADAWENVRRSLVRGILDPLARHAAYNDHSPEAAALTRDLSGSPFYTADVEPFWTRARSELSVAHGVDAELGASLDTLETLIDRFLHHLGICVTITEDSGLDVRFNRRWAAG